MKKLIPLVLLFLFVGINFAFSQDEQDNRRSAILNIIDEELAEVSRLSGHFSEGDPKLLLRIAELNLEKARIIAEDENKEFLKLDYETRKRVDKKDYFRKSRGFFKLAQRACNLIIAKHKNFRDKAKVYYILAFNSKEFGDEEMSKGYLASAIKSSPKNSEINNNAKLALADIYFNDDRYGEAFKLYQSSLKNGDKDKWWTKNAYNMAWSAFKLKHYDLALNLMKQVFRMSKDDKYVDMSQSVIRNIAFIYGQSGRIEEGLAFYSSINQDMSVHLISLGKSLIDKGKLSDAEDVLNQALKLSKTDNERKNINLMLLNLYEVFGNHDKHLVICRELLKYHEKYKFDAEELKTFTYQVEKLGAILQKQAVGHTYELQKKIKFKKAIQATEYFEILCLLQKDQAFKFKFLKAETYYSVGKYENALDEYKHSYDYAKEVGDKKFKKMSMDGMLTVLSSDHLSKSVKEAQYLPVYKRYLEMDNQSERAKKIYQKVFSIFLENNQIEKCDEILVEYKKSFPQDFETQEAMLARIMDYYRKTKNKAAILNWVAKIRNGEFRVSKNYAKKLKLFVMSMEFEKVEMANTKGDKKSALKGYLEIYNNKVSMPSVRKNAAYNLSVLFHELNEPLLSYEWANNAIKLMNSTEVEKFDSSFLALSNELFNRRKFKESTELSMNVMLKLCQTSSAKKDIFFKNISILFIAENDLGNLLKLMGEGKRCSVSSEIIENIQLELLNIFSKMGKWNTFNRVLADLEKNPKKSGSLIKPLHLLSKAYLQAGRVDEYQRIENNILQHYLTAKKFNLPIELEHLDIVAKIYLKKLQEKISYVEIIKLEFPESRFNELLKKKLQTLDEITKEGMKILEIGSGQGIVLTYKELTEIYKKIGKQIGDFTPEGKSESYNESFKKSMTQLSQPILEKSQQLFSEAREHIMKNAILAEDNNYFINQQNMEFKLEYPIERGIVMDRGGNK